MLMAAGFIFQANDQSSLPIKGYNLVTKFWWLLFSNYGRLELQTFKFASMYCKVNEAFIRIFFSTYFHISMKYSVTFKLISTRFHILI